MRNILRGFFFHSWWMSNNIRLEIFKRFPFQSNLLHNYIVSSHNQSIYLYTLLRNGGTHTTHKQREKFHEANVTAHTNAIVCDALLQGKTTYNVTRWTTRIKVSIITLHRQILGESCHVEQSVTLWREQQSPSTTISLWRLCRKKQSSALWRWSQLT